MSLEQQHDIEFFVSALQQDYHYYDIMDRLETAILKAAIARHPNLKSAYEALRMSKSSFFAKKSRLLCN